MQHTSYRHGVVSEDSPRNRRGRVRGSGPGRRASLAGWVAVACGGIAAAMFAPPLGVATAAQPSEIYDESGTGGTARTSHAKVTLTTRETPTNRTLDTSHTGSQGALRLKYRTPVIAANRFVWDWAVTNNGSTTVEHVLVTHELSGPQRVRKVPPSCAAKGTVVVCRVRSLRAGDSAAGTIETASTSSRNGRFAVSGYVTWRERADTESGWGTEESWAAELRRGPASVRP